MFSGPFRIQPQGPAQAYQTFQIATPRGPEFQRPATCQDVDCEAWRCGWVTRVPVASDLEHTVRLARHQHPWVSETEDNGERVFTYAPGTPCFQASQHRQAVRPDLPQLFVVRGGDWRGNPTGARRVHQRPEDWVEHLQEETGKISDLREKG